jgi:tight adherence protein B
MTERDRIRGDIQTYTSQQRLTGAILSVYPAALGLLFFAIKPDLWGKFFTETLGLVLLGVAVGLQFLGFLIIRSILRVDY